MKIVVTGGAGFIGSHVVELYVSRGHEVLIVDSLVTGKRENLHPKARFFELDIRDAKVADLIRSEKPDVINHHAAQMDVRKSVADPIFDAQVNILGTIELLKAARDAEVKKVLFVSSGGAVYGEQETRSARASSTPTSSRPNTASSSSPSATRTSTARARTHTAKPAWSRSSAARCSAASPSP